MRLGRRGVESPRRLAAGFALALGSTVLLGGVFAALGIGPATAQEGTEEPSTPAELVARRRSDLSPADQLAEGHRALDRAQLLSRRIAAMLDEARREGDVIRVTCLDDKLTQVNAHLRTLTSRVASLEESNQVGDDGRRNHEFTVISVIGQNLSELDRASNECIGQDIYETGTTRVTTTIDPTTPDEDPTLVPVPPETTVPAIPPAASPMM